MIRFSEFSRLYQTSTEKRQNASCKSKFEGERKMNKMNIIATIFTILIFCAVNTLYAQTSRTTLSTNEWSIISNKLNPYDEIGLKHNQFLVEFFKSEEFRSFNDPKDKNVNSIRESENKNVITAVEKFINRLCKKQINICSGPNPNDRFSNDFGRQLRIVQEEKDPMKTLSSVQSRFY
jgi:hypothetical protein